MLTRGDALSFASHLPLAVIFRALALSLTGCQFYFCLEVRPLRLDTVSTARGSGWVRSLFRARLRRTHPLPRGGSDCVQVKHSLPVQPDRDEAEKQPRGED